ncbi:MAG: phosphoribosylformylglycinamidine synthase subunit PurQ / glutaminase [Desulfovibrionales bacterium]|jgi:phosphoribosylformylglycinamidine synthase|nr:phosphoribosylformylglycinamidine synthase subunit PurQ / glutaminase [Desulfovibrionales bacterium]
MAKAKAIVITGFGTNCEQETAFAARQAGAQADIVFFSDLTAGKARLTDYNFLLFPGGFLDGDDLGAAQAAALRWKHSATKDGTPLIQELDDFLTAGGLALGICNGFQLMVKLGLLPGASPQRFKREVSLSNNDSARFEDRWVHLKVNPAANCVFLHGLTRLYLPVRHGEGKIVADSDETLRRLQEKNLVALQYSHPETGEPTQEYPWNPNGSPLAVAGLTDPTGRILGLMPHPEAYNHETNHPGWTRGETGTLGVTLFKNAVNHLESR